MVKDDKKIKILFVVESFSTGVYSISHDIACNIDPRRFEVRIIHSLRPDSPASYKEDFATTGVSLSYVAMDGPHNLIKSIRLIKNIIDEYKPDVIHLHSSMAGAVGRIATKGHHKGLLLYTPHGFSFLKEDSSMIKRLAFRTAEKLLAFLFGGTILAISRDEYNRAKTLTHHVEMISNFIDLTKFPISSTIKENTVVISGRISNQKNPLLFNEIALALAHISFIWVGDGPLKEALQAPNITITGYVERAKALEIVSQATLYLQTSLWEGLSVSILEAMAMKKAVVASNIEANKELVKEGITGYLCSTDSSADFVTKIELLLDDDKKREACGNAGLEVVKEHYDLPIAIKAYEEIYYRGTL